MSWTPPDACPSCRAEVIWGWTEGGKRMALDPAEYPRDDTKANAAWYRDINRRVRVRILRADRPLEGFEHRAMPHVATCPVETARRAAERAARARHPSAQPSRPRAIPAVPDELSARRRRRSGTGTPS